MKPCQAILAFISYFLLQFIAYFYISEIYYTVIAGIIALIVFAFLLYRKQMLHMSTRDLNVDFPSVTRAPQRFQCPVSSAMLWSPSGFPFGVRRGRIGCGYCRMML